MELLVDEKAKIQPSIAREGRVQKNRPHGQKDSSYRSKAPRIGKSAGPQRPKTAISNSDSRLTHIQNLRISLLKPVFPPPIGELCLKRIKTTKHQKQANYKTEQTRKRLTKMPTMCFYSHTA